ncbi:MAG: FHA domain-containing protein [Gammaproteobacteria bacterium]|nr:FHA domain-containing protein [Gammaproteobacteria bacterium]
MRARLTLHFSDAPARQLYLEEAREYLLGRGPASDIVVDSSRVSRKHARLRFSDGSWHIEDLGSKNGIAIDGEGVDQATLDNNCWIALGELLMRYELRTDEQADADASNQRRRYETSLELRRAIRPSAGVEPLLRKVLSSVMHLVGMERGFAMLARADGDMEIMSTVGADSAHAFRGSRGAINHAMESGASVVSMDVQTFAPLAERPSIIAGNIRALVCLPMTIADRTIGVVYADSSELSKILTDLDLDILEGLISHATTALALAQLDQEIGDIDSILRDGDVNVENLSQWRESLPGYRHPVEREQIDMGGTGFTWSKVASGS